MTRHQLSGLAQDTINVMALMIRATEILSVIYIEELEVPLGGLIDPGHSLFLH
jgi:hypothetical protein